MYAYWHRIWQDAVSKGISFLASVAQAKKSIPLETASPGEKNRTNWSPVTVTRDV